MVTQRDLQIPKVEREHGDYKVVFLLYTFAMVCIPSYIVDTHAYMHTKHNSIQNILVIYLYLYKTPGNKRFRSTNSHSSKNRLKDM